MKKNAKIIIISTLAVCLDLFVSQTFAQVMGRQQMPQNGQAFAPGRQNQPEPISLRGKIAAIRMGMAKITTESGESWLVKIPNSAKIRVLGSAKLDFLRPGMFVLFKANLDQRGKVQDKVAELKIFTPTQTSNLGLFPESGFSGGPDAAMEAAADAEAQKKTKAKRDVKAKDKTANMPATAYEVSGQIASFNKRSGEWLVKTPHGDVNFELDEGATVSLDLADYSLASPGDSISCQAAQNAQFMATADSLEIELARPLPYDDEAKSSRSELAKGREAKSKFASDKAATNKEQAEKLAALLAPKGSQAGSETLELTLRGKKISLQPCMQGPAATLQKRFGQPKKTYATGSVTKPDGKAASPERWQIWTWGDVKVAVDRRGKTRFYLLDAND